MQRHVASFAPRDRHRHTGKLAELRAGRLRQKNRRQPKPGGFPKGRRGLPIWGPVGHHEQSVTAANVQQLISQCSAPGVEKLGTSPVPGEDGRRILCDRRRRTQAEHQNPLHGVKRLDGMTQCPLLGEKVIQ